MKPRFLPCSSTPQYFGLAHSQRGAAPTVGGRMSSSMSGSRLAAARRSMTVNSATVRWPYEGELHTAMPSSRAAAQSTPSMPTPNTTTALSEETAASSTLRVTRA